MNSQQISRGSIVALALGMCAWGTVALAQDRPSAAGVGRPQQLLPTGEEDAAAAAPAGVARAAVSTAAVERQQLEDALVKMTSESSKGLNVVRHGDGSSSVNLEGRFMSVAIATPTKDGGYELSCQTGEGAATHAKHAHDVATGKAPKVLRSADPSKQQPALEEK